MTAKALRKKMTKQNLNERWKKFLSQPEKEKTRDEIFKQRDAWKFMQSRKTK